MSATNSAFKAIADPARREILRLLRTGEMTAGDLAARFDVSKPTMSPAVISPVRSSRSISRRAGSAMALKALLVALILRQTSN